MVKMIVFWSVFMIYLIGCKGIPIAGPQVNQAIQESENQPNGPSNSEKLQQLYSLLNEPMLMETLSEFSMHTNFQKDERTIPPNSLTIQSSTERLYTSKPNFEFNAEENSEPQETQIIPLKVSFLLIPEQNIGIRDRIEDITNASIQVTPHLKLSTKSPLEYQSQRPSFVSAPGGISGGHLGQLIPSGDPLPAGLPEQNITIKDRIKESTTTTIQELPNQKASTKLSLEYQSQRPTYAGAPGGISGGHLGQLVPPGPPLPAGPPEQNITIEDRIKETTTVQELLSQKPSTKSPLEYQSQRPTFAGAPGGISGGNLGQLIPPGNPLPAGPPEQNIIIEDRIKETTTVQELLSQKPSTKSPLEYQSQRPTFAGAPGGISGGNLGQLIPPGNPLPAGPPEQNIIIEDRIKETTTVQELLSQKPSTKSPLEYQSQRPTFAGAPGGISGGHLGQLIPSGNPLPAGPPEQNITIEDRIKETTTVQELLSQKPSTKSPLEYQSQRPTFAGAPGGISGGNLGQLIPPGNPLPAGPPEQNINIEDRIKDTASVQEPLSQKPSTKSPLEYQSQRPTFAGAPGGISGGHLGQLIPPGNPLPAGPPPQNINIEDRVKETITTTVKSLPNLQAFSVAYKPQRPSYAGQLSNGYLGQLIPPGNPWPAS